MLKFGWFGFNLFIVELTTASCNKNIRTNLYNEIKYLIADKVPPTTQNNKIINQIENESSAALVLIC